MTQIPTQGPVVPVKAQPNVYTALLIISILCLAAAVGISVYNLTVNYDMTLGQIFDKAYKPLVK